jgi:hypothetical protein
LHLLDANEQHLVAVRSSFVRFSKRALQFGASIAALSILPTPTACTKKQVKRADQPYFLPGCCPWQTTRTSTPNMARTITQNHRMLSVWEFNMYVPPLETNLTT